MYTPPRPLGTVILEVFVVVLWKFAVSKSSTSEAPKVIVVSVALVSDCVVFLYSPQPITLSNPRKYPFRDVNVCWSGNASVPVKFKYVGAVQLALAIITYA